MKTKGLHYSGAKSKGFWKRVNVLPREESQTLYHCGILLQEMEERVHHWLLAAEERTDSERGRDFA